MAQFASDSFTGSAGTVLSTYSANWVRHGSYASGEMVLSDADRVRRSNSNITLYYNTGTPASADYSVSADIFTKTANAGDSFLGVAGRINTAANTLYMARYGGGADVGWQLFKIVSGVATQLGSTSSQSLTDETAYNVKLEMVGTAIKLFKELSGSATISATDSAITAAGVSGLRMSGGTAETNTTGGHLDNFSADDIGAAAVSSVFARAFPRPILNF